jgi:beta-galactosidase/beta-glucuronidase
LTVRHDPEKQQARVVVKTGNATGRAGHGTMSVAGKSVDAAWDANGGLAETIVDLSGAKLWDEFSPNLHDLTVKLGGDSRTVRFGLRKFAARGTQFTMNGPGTVPHGFAQRLAMVGIAEQFAHPHPGRHPRRFPGWW